MTASLDLTARVWDAATGQQIMVLRGHNRRLASAVFSPDGSRVLTAAFDIPPASGMRTPASNCSSCGMTRRCSALHTVWMAAKS